MVKYCGPETQQAQNMCCLIGICFIGAFGAGIICCLISGCVQGDPKDQKEVYKVHDMHYTLNGTLDPKVGPWK